MASLEDVVTSIGPVRAHVRAAYEEIIRACPYTIYFAWGAPGRGTGDHAVGLALDIMNYSLGGGVNSPGPERREVQNWVKAYALQHRVRLGLTYVIADRQIASDESDPDWSWRRYTRSDPHTNHVHMSFKSSHTYHPPTPVEDDDVSPEDIEKIARRAAELVWKHTPEHPLPGGSDNVAIETWLTHGRVNVDQIEAIVTRLESKLNAALAEGES